MGTVVLTTLNLTAPRKYLHIIQLTINRICISRMVLVHQFVPYGFCLLILLSMSSTSAAANCGIPEDRCTCEPGTCFEIFGISCCEKDTGAPCCESITMTKYLNSAWLRD